MYSREKRRTTCTAGKQEEIVVYSSLSGGTLPPHLVSGWFWIRPFEDVILFAVSSFPSRAGLDSEMLPSVYPSI